MATPALVPGNSAECSAAAIAATTGYTLSNLTCHAGWASGTSQPCAAGTTCNQRDVVHVGGPDSWVYVGVFDAACAESLAATGMTVQAARYFAPVCDPAALPERTNIRPGSRDARVPALQVALVALGYPIAIDGTYGPATEAAVRDFQSRTGLDADGWAGPRTQEALGI